MMSRYRPSPGAGRFRAAARRPSSGTTSAVADDRARGALLGAFVGDALGMPYEGAPPGSIPATLEMVEARLGRGTYTDDTQMTIALAESLVRCDVVDVEDLARAFRTHYDPRRGYGKGTRQVLQLWDEGIPVEEAAGRLFGGAGSLGNGAAMRVAPVGVRFAEDIVVLSVQAARSARLTHAHPLGVDGAVVQGAAVGAAIEGDDPLEAAISVARTREFRLRLVEVAGLSTLDRLGEARAPGSSALESVPPAIAAGAWADDFEAAVTVAIRCGGDTDTVGSMAGAIAGARLGAPAIPSRWLSVLEDGEHGRRHVERLATQLAARARRASTLT